MSVGVNPVFFKAGDVPDSIKNRPTVLEICLAAERSAGQGSVVGAQQINGLWRVYPASQEARNQLLLQGVKVRGTALQVRNTNPYILKDDTGEEKPATKVWVDNLPISLADSEIEHALVKVGCELRSAIKAERARDADGRLTRFLTGRRFVFITVPSVPLEKTLKINIFTAKIYHREQVKTARKVICSKCLEPNHHASTCEKDTVCFACKKPGHKRGDPQCSLPPTNSSSASKGATGSEKEKSDVSECMDECKGEGEENEQNASPGSRSRSRSDSRGRTRERQATLGSSRQLKSPPADRSTTPSKRPRTADGSSSEDSSGRAKQRRRSKGRRHSDQHAPKSGLSSKPKS